MIRLLAGLVAVLAISINTGISETLINVEEAAEITRLQLRLDGSQSSRIYARICDNCELLTLRANSNTLIERGRTQLSLKQAASLKDKGATVLFNPATLQVTRIIFWN